MPSRKAICWSAGRATTRSVNLRARPLRATTLADIRQTTVVDDGVSEALARSLDRSHQAELDPLTVGDLTKRLLAPEAAHWVRRYRDGLTSEAIAAAAKVMTNDELSFVARSLSTRCLAKASPSARRRTSAPGSNPTAREMTKTRSCSRFSKACRTAAAM